MKIEVVRCDGNLEIITLMEPVALVRGEELNSIISATGCQHFFTHDGRYDGWGINTEFNSTEDAEAFAWRIERDRIIRVRPEATGEGGESNG